MAEESSPATVECRNAGTLLLSAIALLATYLLCFLRKLLEVALGVHYIHSEGVVHGDLRGVFCLDNSITNCRYANVSNRPTSSWMTNFMPKSQILDYPDIQKLQLWGMEHYITTLLPPNYSGTSTMIQMIEQIRRPGRKSRMYMLLAVFITR